MLVFGCQAFTIFSRGGEALHTCDGDIKVGKATLESPCPRFGLRVSGSSSFIVEFRF